MAGFLTVLLRRSLTPGAKPTAEQLDDGELAANVADRRLFLKDTTDEVAEFVAKGDARDLMTTVNVSTNQTLVRNTCNRVNSTTGPITLTLPASASLKDGDCVAVLDAVGEFDVNAVTVARNTSQTIDGTTDDILLDTQNIYVEFIWIASASNWRLLIQPGASGGIGNIDGGTF